LKVAVIGGGVAGAASAWRLASRGAEVVCFDRHSPPHALGSSHGESRIIRTAYFEGSWYVPLLNEVFPMWRELEAATGAQILTMTGALMIGGEKSEVVVGAITTSTPSCWTLLSSAAVTPGTSCVTATSPSSTGKPAS